MLDVVYIAKARTERVNTTYNSRGLVEKVSTTKLVYAYSNPDQVSRLTGVTYPWGKVLNYDYGTAGTLNDVIRGLQSLKEGTLTLESYKYLGTHTVVEHHQNQSGLQLTYVEQGSEFHGTAGEQDLGLDRLRRVAGPRWISGSDADVDRYTCAYASPTPARRASRFQRLWIQRVLKAGRMPAPPPQTVGRQEACRMNGAGEAAAVPFQQMDQHVA